MERIGTFAQLGEALASRKGRIRVAVVCPRDDSSQQVMQQALEAGFVEPVVIDGDEPEEACREAVATVRRGEADVLMKGLVNTDVLLRAVLDKENGLLPEGNVLTHVTCAELPTEAALTSGNDACTERRLVLFSDAAVIPYPTDEQRLAQLRYVLEACRALGISEPRVSLIHCTEKVAERKFPFLTHYLYLKERAAAGDFGPCIIDGPLDLKTSLSLSALQKKRIDSPLEGRADALLFPDIEAGNVFYKMVTLFGCPTAGILCGTTAPVVLPSRGDSVASKMASLMLAAVLQDN